MNIPEQATEGNIQPVLAALELCTLSNVGRLPFKRAIGYVWLDYMAVLLERPPHRRKPIRLDGNCPDGNLLFFES